MQGARMSGSSGTFNFHYDNIVSINSKVSSSVFGGVTGGHLSPSAGFAGGGSSSSLTSSSCQTTSRSRGGFSPADFHQLQDLFAYSNKEISDVLREFEPGGKLEKYPRDGEIDFEGFQTFINILLEMECPLRLVQRLFIHGINRRSLIKKDDTNIINNNMGNESKTAMRNEDDSGNTKDKRQFARLWFAGSRSMTMGNTILTRCQPKSNTKMISPNFNKSSPHVMCKSMSVSQTSPEKSSRSFSTNNNNSTVGKEKHDSIDEEKTSTIQSSCTALLGTGKSRNFSEESGSVDVAGTTLNTPSTKYDGNKFFGSSTEKFHFSQQQLSYEGVFSDTTSSSTIAVKSSRWKFLHRKLHSKSSSRSRHVRGGSTASSIISSYEHLSTDEFNDRERNFLEYGTLCIKRVTCYFNLLGSETPEHKLEFMFRLYDSDNNGFLDSNEIESIIDQMMTVAEYIGWDTCQLRPILEDMMMEIDFDSDGTVSLEEWKRGGMTTVPLLVLLGLDTDVREDGSHVWHLKHFKTTAYCNLCLNMLAGMGRKGLCCTLCKYTVHERCVQRAPASCISTYAKSMRHLSEKLLHHWVEGNTRGRCGKCGKNIKNSHSISGLHCRWCHITVHNRCSSQINPECRLGENRIHILPPTSIRPSVLERQKSWTPKNSVSSNSNTARRQAMSAHYTTCDKFNDDDAFFPPNHDQQHEHQKNSTSSNIGPGSFMISPLENTRPLLVFVNPKSGGRQGGRLLRKFQYILNPRQVYSLGSKGGPNPGLQLFKDVENVRILVCGGDGTMGWVLDALDKNPFKFQPQIAILPLGTGNDLARCLRWGGGYEGECVTKILKKINESKPVTLDRWTIKIDEDVQQVACEANSQQQTHHSNTTYSLSAMNNAWKPFIENVASISTNVVADCKSPDFNNNNIILEVTTNASSTANERRESIAVFDSLSGNRVFSNKKAPFSIINNYFSIGVDAAICHKFHNERERNPNKFNNRMRNKLWYFEYATSEQFASSCKNLQDYIEIICDGMPIQLTSGSTESLQGVAFLNIPSTHGGTNMWGDSSSSSHHRYDNVNNSRHKFFLHSPFSPSIFQGHHDKPIRPPSPTSIVIRKMASVSKRRSHSPNKTSSDMLDDDTKLSSEQNNFAVQAIGDKLIEIVGLENCLHMGQVRTGIRSSGKKLAQCSSVIVRTKKTFPMQIDGEPWEQRPCTIEIKHKNQVPVLKAPPPKSKSLLTFLLGSSGGSGGGGSGNKGNNSDDSIIK